MYENTGLSKLSCTKGQTQDVAWLEAETCIKPCQYSAFSVCFPKASTPAFSWAALFVGNSFERFNGGHLGAEYIISVNHQGDERLHSLSTYALCASHQLITQ